VSGTAENGRQVRVRRARIEEIRALASAYREEMLGGGDGLPADPPIPQGGIFWVAEPEDDGEPVGYAGGRLRPEGLTIGPVFVLEEARRTGVGEALLGAIQRWAEGTRVPVVEVSLAVDNGAGRAFLEASGYVPRRVLFSLTPQRPDRRTGAARTGGGASA
jgi:GNAT superfamily N-acetyltransferase